MPIFVPSSNTLALYIERAISYSPFASLSTRVLDVDIRPGTLAVNAIGGLALLFLVCSYLWPRPPPPPSTLLPTPTPSRFEIDSRWFEKFMDSLPLFEFLMSKYQLSAEDSITWNEDIRNAITRCRLQSLLARTISKHLGVALDSERVEAETNKVCEEVDKLRIMTFEFVGKLLTYELAAGQDQGDQS